MSEEHAAGGCSDISAAIAGDREAAATLWETHRRWVAAILLAYKPRDAELEDLLQTVAISMVRRISELREEGAFRPWLRTVTINVARAAGRKTSRRPAPLRLTSESDVSDKAATDPTVNEEADRIMGLALSLPEGYREPLLLRCVRGMSYRQISALLDLPETTIETRIARGRRMLRELAASQPEDGPVRSRARTKRNLLV